MAPLLCKRDTAGPLSTHQPLTVNSSWSSWAQLIASTSAEYYITSLSATVYNFGFSDISYNSYLGISLGVGGAGAETSVGVFYFNQINVGYNGGSDGMSYIQGDITFATPLWISAGTRIAFRTILNTAGGARNGGMILRYTPTSAVIGN